MISHCGRRICTCRPRLIKLYKKIPTKYLTEEKDFINYSKIAKKSYVRCYDSYQQLNKELYKDKLKNKLI
jgi:hypothetical protein